MENNGDAWRWGFQLSTKIDRVCILREVGSLWEYLTHCPCQNLLGRVGQYILGPVKRASELVRNAATWRPPRTTSRDFLFSCQNSLTPWKMAFFSPESLLFQISAYVIPKKPKKPKQTNKKHPELGFLWFQLARLLPLTNMLAPPTNLLEILFSIWLTAEIQKKKKK